MKLEGEALDLLLKVRGLPSMLSPKLEAFFKKNKSHQFFVTSTMLISLPIQPFGKQLNGGKKKKEK